MQVRVLSSSQYKYTTFFAEIQISLTFRNTQATVKMQRFAADGGWLVLSYEERMEGSIILAAIGMPEDGRPIDFVIVLELFSLKRMQLLTPFDLSSYHLGKIE